MLWYLSDLMEDATEFFWASAKASHTVLLCEMERGSEAGTILPELIESDVHMHRNM